MSRRRVAEKRQILPDPKFKSDLLAKFINHIMEDGKKSIAEKIVYAALDVVTSKSKGKPGTSDEDEGGSGKQGKVLAIDLLRQALDSVRPSVEVRPRRVGGATYQVPIEVREARSYTLAMRWVVQSARERGEHGMTQRLAYEILDALSGKGEAIKKRENMHRMAKANQAFAHFRWN